MGAGRSQEAMFSLLIFLIILSIMILVHEFGHFATARKLGIRVEKFSLGFGKKLFGYKKGFTEYCLCAVPFGGYVKLAGDNRQECKGERYEFLTRRPLERALVIVAGPVLNYALAFLCFWLVNIIGYPNLTTRVGEVMEGYPAKSAGILKDDLIISIDGKKVSYWNGLQEIIHNKKQPEAELEILRNDSSLKLRVSLRQETVRNLLGEPRKINLIGIRPKGETVLAKHDIAEGFTLAGKNLWNMTALTIRALGRILTGAISPRESFVGPLGIFYITSDAVRVGVSAVVHLMAVLSMSLAIFNLLPFPVLDGGHIFILGIEKIRGRHLSQKVEERINQIGLGFIITLAVFVFLNDLDRLGALEKIVKIFRK
jgi:regulator of sigma E protease